MRNRRGVTLADALCGLLIVSLGLGLYFQTNQIIKHRLMVSNQQLFQKRKDYENKLSKNK